MKYQYNIIKKLFGFILIMLLSIPVSTKAQAFVDAVVDSINILPIKLSSFSASRVEKNVQVKWVVETEKNVSHYAVQKSYDGVNFETIINVKAASTSTYSYTDNNVAEKTLYYRLEAVDIDGKSIFTNIIMLKSNASLLQEISVYPNPITNYSLNLSFKNLPLEKYNVEVKTTNGVLVFNRAIVVSSNNSAMMLELPKTLNKGFYVLQLYNEKGFVEHKKIVIN